MKIGLFGGSFNPPHLGHLFIALDVYNSLELDLIFFIPSKNPAHKQGLETNAEHRFNMCKLAISDIPFFKISDYEIKNKGISYSYKTVKYFREKFKDSDLYLIIGSDWIARFNTWKNYKYILQNTKLVVVDRIFEIENIELSNGMKIYCEIEKNGLKKCNIITDSRNIEFFYIFKRYDISSSEIRSLIKNSRFFKIYLPEAVYNYIQHNGLYK